MKKFQRFLFRLICALTALIAISAELVPVKSGLVTNWSAHVVYAKKTKKAKKKTRKIKKKRAATAAAWRWKKPHASVYIELDDNQALISATNDAINAWNATKAFTFTQTKKKKKANIVIGQVYSPNTNYAGYTTFSYYVKSKLLASAITRLNAYYLQNFSPYYYSYDRIVNTVEHELGHAIGLKHNDGVSVMYPTGSVYPIEPADIERVKKLYRR